MNQQEREAWLAERKKGLGGTDVACILLAACDDESEKLARLKTASSNFGLKKQICLSPKM